MDETKTETGAELARKLLLVLELERDKRIELRNALIKSEERVLELLLELLLERAALEKRVRELERRNFELELELERILYRSENAPRSRYDYDYESEYESGYESEYEYESEDESEDDGKPKRERNYEHYDEPRPKAREKRQDHWSRSDLRGGHARGRKRRATIRDYRLGRVLIRDKNRCRDENPKPSGWRARQGWRSFWPRLTKRQRAEREFEYVPEPYLPFARRADGLPIPKWALAVEVERCLNGCPLLSGDRCVRGLCFGCYTRKYMARRRHSRGPVFWTSQELAASLQDTAWRTLEKLTSRAIEGLPGSIEALAEYRGWGESLATMYVAKERERRLARSDF